MSTIKRFLLSLRVRGNPTIGYHVYLFECCKRKCFWAADKGTLLDYLTKGTP